MIRLALLMLLALVGEGSVRIVRPEAGVPVFGRVEIEAEVEGSEPVLWVVFRVDGREVGVKEKPPWLISTDVGEHNVGHLFEVEVQCADDTGRVVSVESSRIEVDLELDLALQQIYATVTRAGERALDLTAEDFEIRDEGERQQIVTFGRGNVPLAAILLVDASDSMRGARLRAAQSAAEALVGGLRPLDEAKLLVVSDRILHDTPFTDIPEVMQTGLTGVEPRGSTALHDHLFLALEQLESRQGQRTVVVLSDGIDVTSVLEAEELLAAVRRSRALVYWIRLGDPGRQRDRSSAWRGAKQHRRGYERLERAVAVSGGRVLTVARIEETRSAVLEILAELRDQYVLGYYPSARSGSGAWHRVRIRLDSRELEVRAREGYFDD